MPLTLLFDLDGTLLDTNLETFVPAYFQALAAHFSEHLPPGAMLPALSASTNLMYASQDPARALRDVFDDNYYRQLGISRSDVADLT